MQTSVDELYHSLKKQELALQSLTAIDIADLQETQRVFVKYLILAASSFFEEQIKTYIRDFVSEVSKNNKAVIKFFDVKLLDRGYHSIIDWKEETKLKTFCKFFDANIQTYLDMHDPNIESHFSAFLRLGIDRNFLVHKNLSTYNVNCTLDDVFNYYESAKKFVDSIPTMLKTT